MNDHNLEYERPLRPRRSSSAGRQTVLQIRASSLVRKLGLLTSKLGAGARFKPTSNDTKPGGSPENHTFRKARSMDILRSKPYMSTPMLAVGFDSQALTRNSADGSHESGSASGSDMGELRSTHGREPSNSNSNSIAQGLAITAMVAEASLRPPEGSDGRPNVVMHLSNGPNNTSQANNMNISHKSDALEFVGPPLPEKRPGHPRLSTLPPLNFNLKGTPPDQRPQRFSPSVIVRPPPFPILDLPALPTPIAETPGSGSQEESRTRTGVGRLNSMPMLPMEGADERENDPDHEHYGLDEDEEGDDEENEEDGTCEAAGSEDEDEETGHNGRTNSSLSSNATIPSPVSSLFVRTRAFSPRLPMPVLSTPSLSNLFSNIGGTVSQSAEASTSSASPSRIRAGSATGVAEPIKISREEVATPKAVQASYVWDGNGTQRTCFDYFSTSGAPNPAAAAPSSQDVNPINSSVDHQPPPSSSSSTATPTVRDYPLSATPMISVAPPPPWTESETIGTDTNARMFKDSFTHPKDISASVPHLGVSDIPKRPSIYHHASKSMIELLPTTLASDRTMETNGLMDSAAIGCGAPGRDVKGKGKLLPAEDSVTNLQKLHTAPGKGRPGKDQSDANFLLAGGLDAIRKEKNKALPLTPTVAVHSDLSRSLRRQRSMPAFNTSGPPPPYPAFLLTEQQRRFAPPLPRDDEGIEELPAYSNAIRLTAIMPRKMEFSAPGVPSRDRKWRRVHCVLEGTAFRVYDAPPRVSGVSAIGGWWERKVGVGDVSSGLGTSSGASATPGETTNIIIGRKEPKRRMKWEEELQAEEAEAERAESGSGRTSTTEVSIGSQKPQTHKSKLANLLHPNRSRLSLTHGSTSSPSSPRSSFQTARTSAESSVRPSVDLSSIPASSSSAISSSAAAVASPSSSTSGSSSSLSTLSTRSGTSPSSAQMRRQGHLRSDSAQSANSHSRSNSRSHSLLNPDAQGQACNSPDPNKQGPNFSDTHEPAEADLLRLYSLQRAESGLASDYTKRKNVVRVRLEGEQFLLQCKDVASVVEWIEGLQAATNIALDLDERPMPKGPIFPRRRRRRRVQRTESGTDSPAAGATATAATT